MAKGLTNLDDQRGPEYKAWRKAIVDRDGRKCKKCGYRGRVQAHHIRPWATNPELRYVLSNGISLCTKCHKSIRGNEEAYIRMCYTLMSSNTMRMRLGKEMSDDE